VLCSLIATDCRSETCCCTCGCRDASGARLPAKCGYIDNCTIVYRWDNCLEQCITLCEQLGCPDEAICGTSLLVCAEYGDVGDYVCQRSSDTTTAIIQTTTIPPNPSSTTTTESTTTTPIPQTCEDRCGGEGIGDCWCDSDCEKNDDCCPDYYEWCVTTTNLLLQLQVSLAHQKQFTVNTQK
jgi:hypothetical protein